MLFNYQTANKEGQTQTGSIDAPSLDLAIASLQRRGLIVISINPAEKKSKILSRFSFLNRVSQREIVIMSRQIATLFEAKVSVLSTFQLMAEEAEHPRLREALLQITDDVKGGAPISSAMNRHNDIFSPFFVSMVKSGEESGKLSETFNYLASYLDRSYELTSRARNALIYPAFVVVSFVVVMILMLMFVIPKLSTILKETGQTLPIYTQAVMGLSQFFVDYGLFVLILLIILGIFLYRYTKTTAGMDALAKFKLAVPYVGVLYQKLYLSRIADNLYTMLTSGISMVRALEITADVVDNYIYQNILKKSIEGVKAGQSLSDIMGGYPDEIPGVMVQMMRVGEESGKLGFVLETMAKFYQREVDNEVNTLVGLIEPVMIVVLGVGVGILLTSVLVPIYNIASGI